VADIAGELGGIGIPCDVTSAETVEAALAQARAAHGVARILVNCAGVGTSGKVVGRRGPLPLEDFRRVIDINLVGTFNVIRLFVADALTLDPLEEGERAAIVNTASVAAYEGQVGQAAYAASKAGVVGMTLPIARELAASGIRVCTIAPGIFETPMMAAMPQAVQDALSQSVPFPSRFGRATEYAKLVLHILDNVMLNGETIRLDGALRMPPR
jgi:NAD(P)-dependent dehydrogenase (short-subunit alcohol dehydrogenase family)